MCSSDTKALKHRSITFGVMFGLRHLERQHVWQGGKSWTQTVEAIRRTRTWTPRLTYQFTHGHFTHIAMNTVVTLFTGIPLEGRCSSFIWLLRYFYHLKSRSQSWQDSTAHGESLLFLRAVSFAVAFGTWHGGGADGLFVLFVWLTRQRTSTFSSHSCSFSTGHMIQLWSACLPGAMHWWKLAAKDYNMHTIPKLKTRRSNDKSKSDGKHRVQTVYNQMETIANDVSL